MNKSSKIYVAGGHSGLVGSAIVRNLKEKGYTNILIVPHSELDLLDQKNVQTFFENERPEYVFLAAAKVGGILANKTQKADFIYENLQVQNNVIYSSWKYKVKKLLFLGSSCIYPKYSPQPIKEEYFLTGKLEETNDAYAIAKIAGIMMCQSYNTQYKTNFISVMPTNLYGPHDNFDLNHSHVLPAMIRKFYEAKLNGDLNVTLWGTGEALREFLYIDDLADACVFLMEKYNGSEFLNIGVGKDISIKELAELIKKIVGYEGTIVWDTTKPNGTPRKLLNIEKLRALGWEAKTPLNRGIQKTLEWFKQNYEQTRKSR